MNLTVGLLRWLADTLYGEAEAASERGEPYTEALYLDAADDLREVVEHMESRG